MISQLRDGAAFTNYRPSRLTRLLQPPLGGSTRTGTIGTVTPAVLEETHWTLGFDSGADSINDRPQINEVMSDSAHLGRLRREVHGLRAGALSGRGAVKAVKASRADSPLQHYCEQTVTWQIRV